MVFCLEYVFKIELSDFYVMFCNYIIFHSVWQVFFAKKYIVELVKND